MKWHDLPRSDTDDRLLEQQLGWSENTIAVLRQAFTQQLPRSVSWHAPAHEAFRDAARYYKRGVPLLGKAQPLPTPPRTQLSVVAEFNDLQAYLADRYVVCDQQVAQLHRNVINSAALTIAAEEQQKNLAAAAQILQQWRAQGSPQQWAIVGGGIALDVAAFAAALGKAEMVLLPTTLLAMVDAAHGGKNGVNFPPWGKNQLGTFYFAEHVIICPAWLRTLPLEELQAGAWEGIKHAVLAGDAQLLQAWLRCLEKPPTVWPLPLLQKTAQVKVAIVQRDPYERGERKVLNFGHTLAHALEAVAQDNGTPLRHGQAVGIGILYVMLLSRALGKIKKIAQLSALSNSPAMLTRTALAVALGHDLNDAQLWKKLQHYLGQDKKRRGNATWILLQDAEPLPRVCPEPQAVDDVALRDAWQQLTSILP